MLCVECLTPCPKSCQQNPLRIQQIDTLRYQWKKLNVNVKLDDKKQQHHKSTDDHDRHREIAASTANASSSPAVLARSFAIKSFLDSYFIGPPAPF